jgi:hypothetical protein
MSAVARAREQQQYFGDEGQKQQQEGLWEAGANKTRGATIRHLKPIKHGNSGPR